MGEVAWKGGIDVLPGERVNYYSQLAILCPGHSSRMNRDDEEQASFGIESGAQGQEHAQKLFQSS